MDPIVEKAIAQADQTEAVSIGRGVVKQTGALIAQHLSPAGRPIMVIADERTWEAAGAAVHKSIIDAGLLAVEPLVFPAKPTLYANLDNVTVIVDALRHTQAQHGAPPVPVAVGAGTLNDLVKMAAKQLDVRYAVVATAASMDGYTGAGAPISDNGVKITVNCVAPQVVVFDLDVAATAPAHMVASGYGDLAAKIPGGADWILADAAGVEPIDERAWELVQSGVPAALSQPNALAAGRADAYEGLVSGLVLSGLAMQVYRGTRPASGAEHYFSHIWELAHLGAELDPPLSHGDKVAIGTLAMLAFYQCFLRRDLTTLDIDTAIAAYPDWETVEADIRRTFDTALADHAVKETRVKFLTPDQLRTRLNTLASVWPRTRSRLETQLVDPVTFAEQLREAGAPSRPADIGLSVDDVRATFPKAMYYRSRYTVLDVARETGWFNELVDETFSDNKLWS